MTFFAIDTKNWWSFSTILSFIQVHVIKVICHSSWRNFDIEDKNAERVYFVNSSIIAPICTEIKRVGLTVLSNEVVKIWKNYFTKNRRCFSSTTTTSSGNFRFREMFLNNGPMWSTVEIKRLCWTKKFVTITSALVTLFWKSTISSLEKNKSVNCLFQDVKFFNLLFPWQRDLASPNSWWEQEMF